jgi:hypothetical protein
MNSYLFLELPTKGITLVSESPIILNGYDL